MASKPKSVSAGDAFEPEQLYEIKLCRAVEGPGGAPLSPGAASIKVKGKHIAALGDAVTDARPV